MIYNVLMSMFYNYEFIINCACMYIVDSSASSRSAEHREHRGFDFNSTINN